MLMHSTSIRPATRKCVGMTFLALAACTQPPPPVAHDFSDRALAALPPGQDLTLVYRGKDGCYKYIRENDLSGYVLPLVDEYNRQICDDLNG